MTNGFYVVCADRSGSEGSKGCFGTSAVCGSSGEVLVVLNSGDGVVVADLDADLVARTQASRPFLRECRLDLYTALRTERRDRRCGHGFLVALEWPEEAREG